MNVFFLHNNPYESAKLMVDRHLPKMIVESAQILSNCFTLEQLSSAPTSQKGNARKHSYPNHPCCKWAKRSKSNMMWVIDNAFGMQMEREHRFGSEYHFSLHFIDWCRDNIHQSLAPTGPLTRPEMAFNGCDEYKNPEDVVGSYRLFYAHDKQFDSRGRPMDIYTNRDKPNFWST